MGVVSNFEVPDRPEVVVLHNGSAHDVKAYVYDANGLKGVWTTDDRWIDQAQINDAEPKFPPPLDDGCSGYPPTCGGSTRED
jgi:hypothetical protein